MTSSDPKADLDVFFLNTDGYSTMCGHAVLAITKVVLETGLIVKEGAQKQVVINTPAGLVYASASVVSNEVRDINFRNVASFMYLRDQKVEVDGLGSVAFDVAFGGLFYAIVKADAVNCGLGAENLGTTIDVARKIKKSISGNSMIEHPFEKDLSGLFGVLFIGKPQDSKHYSRNVNVFEDGGVDRSSTGTGVSARAALLIAKGELKLNETIVIESVLGSTLSVRAVETVKFGDYEAIVPEVGGEVSITGKHEWYFHSEDPFTAGFMLRA
jgi:proline racemase